jgi:hypothetical protein
MRYLSFFILFLIVPLSAEERVRYVAESREPVEANFKIEICQTVQEHEVRSSLAGELKASLSLEKEGVAAGGAITGLPDRVKLTIEHWEGLCSAGEESVAYSSEGKKREGREISTSHERAAAVLVGVPLTFSVHIDDMAGSIRFEDQGDFAALVSRNPLVQEVCSMATLEALLQQILAPAYTSDEQWQKLANSIAVPVAHAWEEQEGEVSAKMEGEISRARILLTKPLQGTFVGSGTWKRGNGLHFRAEQQVEYTAHLEGGEGQKLHVEANWLIQGNG